MTEYLIWLVLFFIILLPITAFLIVKLGTYGYLVAKSRFRKQKRQRYEDKMTRAINNFFNERTNSNGQQT